jgi:hypothetical protein
LENITAKLTTTNAKCDPTARKHSWDKSKKQENYPSTSSASLDTIIDAAAPKRATLDTDDLS